MEWRSSSGRDRILLVALSTLAQLAYLCILPISIEGDALGYYLVARYLAGDPHGLFLLQHPVGYPAFLFATGATWLKSFKLTIAMQAIMGIAGPLLLYETLRELWRPLPLAVALIYVVSGVPYSYAKLLITEQLYVFCVLVATFAVSRFISSKRARYAILAVAVATAAVLVRNEALYLGLLAFLVMAVVAWPRRRLLGTLALSGSLAFSALMAWSAERAHILGDPALVGSLSNYYGHTLFYRVYLTLGGPVNFWQCVTRNSRDPSCARSSIPLVYPENGPASHELGELLMQWATIDGRYRFPDQTPQQIVQDFFTEPTEAPPFDRYGQVSGLVQERFGDLKGDEFLARVAAEAFHAHPLAFYMLAAGIPPYFGISFDNALYYLALGKKTEPVIFANWQEDGYEAQPYNPDFVRPYLYPELFREYQDSAGATSGPWQQGLLHMGRIAHSVVRNSVGLVLLIASPLLLWTRRRALTLLLVGMFGLMLGTYSLSSGYSMRFEHVMIPVMLMIAAIAADTLVHVIDARRARLRASLAASASVAADPAK
ncbi:MAG: hypothetical protein ACHQRJ_02135 [Alphaproteobacteria bacterium]